MSEFRAIKLNHFNLPQPIQRLGDLAYNLWWTWIPSAERLFSRIDPSLWERLAHNPVLLLRQVERVGSRVAGCPFVTLGLVLGLL